MDKRKLAVPVAALASLALVGSALAAKSTPGRPTVKTGGVTHVVGTSGTLNGSVTTRTLPTSYYFKYGPPPGYASQTTPVNIPGSAAPTKVSATVTNLLPGDHYVLVASNSAGVAEGKPVTFTVKKKSSFVLPKSFEATVVGGRFVLSGTLTGADNNDRQIVLEETPYPYRLPYADVGSIITTSASGSFSFSVPDLRTSTKFRVATVGSAPIYSDIVPALVEVDVTLKVRTAGRKGLVRLYGTVAPAEVGAHVLIQLERPPKQPKAPTSSKPEKTEKATEKERTPSFATKFTTIVKHATRSISRFSLVLTVPQSGEYRAFVELAPGPLISGHSQTVALHAGPSTKKKRKKNG